VDWKAKVDLFEQLRREHEFGIGTVAGVAAKFGVHRRMVRQALASAVPPARRYPQRAKPKLDAVASFIDRVLEEDLRAPRKQRHTARRLYRRLLAEFPGIALAESTVRNHVRVWWSPFVGQLGGLDKLGSGFRQAANLVTALAPYASSGVLPSRPECGRLVL
jgi:hypothetical protein